LEKTRAGIICLTPANVNSHWVLFEAGALSKTVKSTYVCPLLIGLKPSDVKGPLAQFQFTTIDKVDMLQLFKTLNSAQEDRPLPETHIERAFSLVWPRLQEQLNKAPMDETKAPPQRSEREMLEEVLEFVRNFGRLPPLETGRLTHWRMSAEDILEEVKHSLSGFLKKRGDRLQSWKIGLISPDKYEFNFNTTNGFEFSEQLPMALHPEELISKLRRWFVDRYRARRQSPIDIQDFSEASE